MGAEQNCCEKREPPIPARLRSMVEAPIVCVPVVRAVANSAAAAVSRAVMWVSRSSGREALAVRAPSLKGVRVDAAVTLAVAAACRLRRWSRIRRAGGVIMGGP